MNGVSFFLLIALSSIVSGTERLIILLAGRKTIIFERLVFNLKITQCTVTIFMAVNFLLSVWFCVFFFLIKIV